MRYEPRWNPIATDVALAVAVAVFLTAGALSAPDTQLLDYAAVLVGSFGLVAWRRAPVTAMIIATVCMLFYSVRTNPGPPAAFPVLITIYATVRAGHRLPMVAAGVAFLIGTLAAGLTGAAEQPVQDLADRTMLLLGWFLAAAVAGTVSKHRQAYREQAEQRVLEAERTQEEVALRRAGQERLRIARELHDSLTHSISIIKVQAAVAVHLARKRGEEVPAALLAIQEASADAMRELRATLEVLRDTAGEPPGSGLDQLDGLVDRVRSAGLPTTLTVTGDRRALPDAVDRAAYRIVQEALTNVARHAGPASASVHVAYGPAELALHVDDDGSATPQLPPTPGNGLTGMRERVTALGGRLHAHPRQQGGFTVRAELPIEDLS
ncbi:sensor histidine kinase [Nonomuraea sp. LPB2021202275-12-8]|uniref:sensor histidine kinase n=1 Tax=Nonomuraea sp. LPB2021202275-12-8 TaxID=3120159 RepID=UPI00300D0567